MRSKGQGSHEDGHTQPPQRPSGPRQGGRGPDILDTRRLRPSPLFLHPPCNSDAPLSASELSVPMSNIPHHPGWGSQGPGVTPDFSRHLRGNWHCAAHAGCPPSTG